MERQIDFGCRPNFDQELRLPNRDNNDTEIEPLPVVENQNGNEEGDAEIVPAIAEW